MLLNLKQTSQNKGLHQVQTLGIIGIVLFHLWSDYFPNGYFGIDIFFVTSGYSMALNRINTKTDVKNFYLRQIQNFVPLYFIIILFYICGSFILHESGHYFQIVWETLWGIGFTKNQEIIDYNFPYESFMTVNGSLLHGWILSVLKYFVLYAPLVSYLSVSTNKLVWILIVILIDSFWAYLGSSTTITGLVTFFPRLWQYLFGTCGFLLLHFWKDIVTHSKLISLPKITRDNQRAFYYCSFLVLFCCLFYPFESLLLSVKLRFVVTFASTIVILSNISNQRKRKFDYVIQYISESSYVIYMVHFPLISCAWLIHYINIPYIGFRMVLLTLTILFTLIFQEFLQKPLRSSPMWKTFVVILFCYLLIVYFCCYLLVIPLY